MFPRLYWLAPLLISAIDVFAWISLVPQNPGWAAMFWHYFVFFMQALGVVCFLVSFVHLVKADNVKD